MKTILADNVSKESILVVFCSFLFFTLLSQVFNCFAVHNFYSSSKNLKLKQTMVSLMFFLSSSCFTLSTIVKDNSILNDPLKEVGKTAEIANKIRIGFYIYQTFSSVVNRTYSTDMLIHNFLYLSFYSYCMKSDKFSAISTLISLKDVNFLFYFSRKVQILNDKNMSDSDFRLFSYLTVMTFSISFTTSIWIYNFCFILNELVDKNVFLSFSVLTFLSNLFLFTKVCCSDVFQINILPSKRIHVVKTKSQ